MVTRFVLLSPARSGSTMVRATLAEHPDILMHGEVMGQNTIRGMDRSALKEFSKFSREVFVDKMMDVRRGNIRSFISDILFRSPENKKAVGFKLIQDQALSVGFADACFWLAEQENVKIIWLRRRNGLARYASSLLAKQGRILLPYGTVGAQMGGGEGQLLKDDYLNPASIGVFDKLRLAGVKYLNSKRKMAGKSLVSKGFVNVDPDEFIQDLRNQESAFLLLRSVLGSLPSLDIFYEDVVSSPDEWFAKIYEFLCVDMRGPSRLVTKKVNPADLYSLILNLPQIKDRKEISQYL